MLVIIDTLLGCSNLLLCCCSHSIRAVVPRHKVGCLVPKAVVGIGKDAYDLAVLPEGVCKVSLLPDVDCSSPCPFHLSDDLVSLRIFVWIP